eukprot:TRINITY_DN514_c0_g1_i1.p1 TRINITY_DN514_c0_g1~~TRINITY_DN514_c0_g1_i1.p1  ORF type:complete len:335 (-),score=92.51 TRINITY_DN514_c0_g1_i1:77-997(-)
MAPKMQRSDPTATNEAYEAYKVKGAFEEWRERKGIIHGIKYDLNIPEEREKFEKAKEMMDKEELDAVRNGTGASEDQQNKAALREKIDHWFDLYDKDNNGFLSLREFQAILVGCGMDRTKAKTLFDAADAMNKDGYLGGKKVGKSDGAVSKNEFFRWIFSGTAEQSGEREIGHAVSEHAQREITPDAALSQLAQVLSEKMHDEAFVEKMEAILVKKGIVAEGGNALTCKDLFNVFDVNKNGTVSTSEFVSGLATIGWKMDNKLAGALFSLIDLEDVKTRFVDAKGNAIYQRSGFLDEKEFMNALMR